MSEHLSGKIEGKDVQMTFRRGMSLGHLLPIWMVCTIILGVRYCLKPHMRLYLCVWCGWCCPDVSLRSVSNLILDFIYS